MRLSPAVVADIEWAVLALTGLIAAISLVGALYAVPWTWKSRQQATTRAFNYLWITRALLQVIAACYALSLDLRLQVLWGAKSVLIPGGYNVDAMCRLYIGLSFGLLEPSFLLLVLFACSHSVSKWHSDPDSNPNLFIFALTVGLTLPMCAVQVFAALFSRIMTQLRYNEELMYKFFAASASVQDTMCPGEPDNPNCAVCLFPEFSTLISAAFALMYLLVLWAVLGRVAGAAINRMLARRIRLLQVCITLFFCASITLRGVTVVKADPFSLDFVGLWAANVLVCCSLILLVCAILVWVPVYDGRSANARLGSLMAAPLFPSAPTELLPLVGYGSSSAYHGGTGLGLGAPKGSFYSHDAPSSDYDYSSHGGDEGLLGPTAAAAATATSLEDNSSGGVRLGGAGLGAAASVPVTLAAGAATGSLGASAVAEAAEGGGEGPPWGGATGPGGAVQQQQQQQPGQPPPPQQQRRHEGAWVGSSCRSVAQQEAPAVGGGDPSDTNTARRQHQPQPRHEDAPTNGGPATTSTRGLASSSSSATPDGNLVPPAPGNVSSTKVEA